MDQNLLNPILSYTPRESTDCR